MSHLSNKDTNRHVITKDAYGFAQGWPAIPVGSLLTLPPGEYYINDDVYLLYTITSSGPITIKGSGVIIYLGEGTLFYYADLANNFFIFERLLVIDGGNGGLGGTAKLFDIDSPTPGFGVVTTQNFVAIGFDSMGDIKNTNLSIEAAEFLYCNQGIYFENCTGAVEMYIVDFNNIPGCEFIKIGGIYNGTLEFNNCLFRPESNETIFNILPTSAITSGKITGAAIDLSAGGKIFATGSKDQTDLYWKATGNKNLQNSTVTIEQLMFGNTTATSIPAQNAYVLCQSSTSFVISNEERMEAQKSPNDGVTTYIGTENTTLKLEGNITMDPNLAGTKLLQAKFVTICSCNLYECTFDNTTNIVIRNAHGLSNGDIICFYDSTGTPPAAFNKVTLYFVVNATTNNFQLSYEPGGAVITFVDNGTPPNVYTKANLVGSVTESDITFNVPKEVVPQAIVRIVTNNKIALFVSNRDGANDIRVRTFYYNVVQSS